MKQTFKAIILLAIFCAACRGSAKLQDRILGPLGVEARLRGSVREILHAHPNHKAVGDGMYLYQASAPDNEIRTVRLRGEGDTILWLQIQDETIAPDAIKEHQLYEAEIDRLASILGEAKLTGNRQTSVRTAHWEGALPVSLRLNISSEPVFARRTLTIAPSQK